MTSWIRPPAVSGRFYPSDPQKLRTALVEYCPMDEVQRAPYAIVAPHAGYVYSGKIAGEVYRRTLVPDEVFILCPNHTGRGARISVWSEGAWETPLGRAPVAEGRARRFLDLIPAAQSDQQAHITEHAIEVQIPFLQWRNPNVRIVPIVLGGLSWEDCRLVGEALASCADGALIVSSTDMSHYIPAREAKRLDELALKALDQADGASLYRAVVEHGISMCGFVPTATTLAAARSQGISQAQRLAYGTSGDVSGDLESVVAYASAWLFRGK